MQVIIGSVINLKKWSNTICGNTKKGTLSAEGGRTNNFKAVLMQMISLRLQKRYNTFMCRR